MQITQQVGESRREGWVASLTSYLHTSLLEATTCYHKFSEPEQ